MSFFRMTGSIIKNIFTRPATRRYPSVPRVYCRNTRGSVSISVKDCVFCGMCQRKCPTAAVTVDRTQKKWKIERHRCIACGYCVEACPRKCLSMSSVYTAPSLTKEEEVHGNA